VSAVCVTVEPPGLVQVAVTCAPATAAFAAAAAGADWEAAPGFGAILTNQAGENAWPIAAATFVLMHRQPNVPAATNAALKFFAWAFAQGGKMAEELDYVPMPANVVGAVQKVWATQIKDPAGKPVYAISR
jgi:phosphate transport system substrate-binding protein